jgi:hypothetical protein
MMIPSSAVRRGRADIEHGGEGVSSIMACSAKDDGVRKSARRLNKYPLT